MLFLESVRKLFEQTILLCELFIGLVNLERLLYFLLHVEHVLFQICDLLLLHFVYFLGLHKLIFELL